MTRNTMVGIGAIICASAMFATVTQPVIASCTTQECVVSSCWKDQAQCFVLDVQTGWCGYSNASFGTKWQEADPSVTVSRWDCTGTSNNCTQNCGTTQLPGWILATGCCNVPSSGTPKSKFNQRECTSAAENNC